MLQDYTIPPYTSPGGVTIPQCTIPYGKQLPYDGTREVGGQTQYKVDIRSINCRGYSFQWVPKGTAISKQDAAKPPVQVQPLNKDGTNRQPYGKPVVRAKGPALNA
jgi:hypothetical protein